MLSRLYPKRIARLLGSLFLLASLAACAARPAAKPAPAFLAPPASPTPKALPAATLLPSSTFIPPSFEPPPTLTSIPKPTLPSPPAKRTHYQLDATLDYAAHSLAVDERITYTNTTSLPLTSLLLVVEAQRYPSAFRLGKITDGEGQRTLQYRVEDTFITLNLPNALEPGESARIALSYALQLLDVAKLPKLRPYPLGYTKLQANFGDWYPFIPPYVPGKGWIAHPPPFYGEHLVYEASDFDFNLRLTGAQTGLVVAASAPAIQDGDWRRYRLEAARSFAWSASPYYEVVTRSVELAPDVSTLLASYAFHFQAEGAKSLLDTMAQALPLYGRLFGNYPRPMLSGVQADFLDGMEYDGLFFLSTDFYNWHKNVPEDFLVALAAHETAHQWWFSLVGNDQAMQPWLDEALCTYSEALYYENFSPQSLDWWWTYRVNYYAPEGWVDTSVYDTPQVVGQYRLYRDPVYLRGALFLDELRRLIGDKAFFDTLRLYASRYAYRQADAAGFWEILRQNTDVDLSSIQMKYFSK